MVIHEFPLKFRPIYRLLLMIAPALVISCNFQNWGWRQAAQKDLTPSLTKRISFRGLNGRLAANQDGNCFVAFPEQGPIVLYNAVTQKILASIETPKSNVFSVSVFSLGDSDYVVAAVIQKVLDSLAGPNVQDELHVFYVTKGSSTLSSAIKLPPVTPSSYSSIKIIDESSVAVSISRDNFYIYDWKSNHSKGLNTLNLATPIRKYPPVLDMALTNNGSFLAFSQFDNYGILNLTDLTPRNILEPSEYPPINTKICDIASDGSLAAFAGGSELVLFRREDGVFRLWRRERFPDFVVGVCELGQVSVVATSDGKVFSIDKEGKRSIITEISGGGILSMRRCGNYLVIGRSDEILLFGSG